MKKILLGILSIILCIPAVLFAGCDNSNGGITLTRYFENKVNYQVYGRTGTNESTLSEFSHNKTDNAAQYTSITFTGIPSWLYQMTLEKITFKVYGNKTEEIELIVSVSNLSKGDQSSTGGSSTFKKTVSVAMVNGKAVKVSVPVNDYFLSNTASTTIKIEVTDSSYFFAENENTGLKFDILNFAVFGEHKAI